MIFGQGCPAISLMSVVGPAKTTRNVLPAVSWSVPFKKRHLNRLLAQQRELVRCVLLDRRFLDLAAFASNRHRRGIESRRLEPLVRPLVEIFSGGCTQRAHEIGEHGIAVAMGFEIVFQSSAEFFLSDQIHQLLDDRCSLAVRDAVKLRVRLAGVFDFAFDGMRRHLIVGAVRPPLIAPQKQAPICR